MRRLLTVAALLLALIPAVAQAASTIDPTAPAQGSSLSSAVVRNNFAAAYNDVSNILGKYAGTSTPANPTNLQDWVDTSTPPIYKFKFYDATTTSWVEWGMLDVNTGVFSVVANSGTLAATAPLTLGFSGGVATYGLSYDSNFAVSGSSLALATVASGDLVGNCTGGTAEPTGCSWNSYANQAIGSASGEIPYRGASSWGTISTGTSGNTIPVLSSSALTFSGVLTSYAGTSAPAPAQTGTLFRGVALDGAVSRSELDSFGVSGVFTCVRADSALATPTALLSGDQICGLDAHGYNGSAYTPGAASILLNASQNWTGTANGTSVSVYTTPNGTTAPAEVMRFENDGGVTVPSTVTGGDKGAGTINASGGLYVGGVAVASTVSPTISGLTVTGSFTATGLVTNSDLVSPTVTVNGVGCTLGGTCTISASAGTITVGTTTVIGGPGVLFNSSSGGTLSALSPVNNAVLSFGGTGSLQASTTLPSGLALGTPASITLTNATGLPFAGLASSSIATSSQYIAGTANTLVPANVAYTAETTTTYGATTTLDFSTFINTAVTLTGNITTMTVSNVKAGQAGQIRFIQDATGSRTTVWNSIFKFAGGVTPTLSTGANNVDALEYNCISSTYCVASLLQNVH